MTTLAVKIQEFYLPHLPNGRMLIGGQWVEALGSERITVLDPATERTIGSVARGQSADIDLAVRATDNALSNASWSKMSALDRERLLTRLANLIEAAGLRPQERGLLPPQSSHLHVAGTIGPPADRSPDTLVSCRRARSRQGRFAPLTRWPEGGPSLTAAARAGKSRVQVGAEGWCRSNKRIGREKAGSRNQVKITHSIPRRGNYFSTQVR
jgi:Aldehyde dehydrogenase family